MRNATIRVFLAAAFSATLAYAALAAEAGGEQSPSAPDSTIVDVTKVKWAPLKVQGLEGAEVAVLRGSVDKAGSELLLRLPPGFKVANHSHTSDETYVWLSGAFTLISNSGERTAFDGPAFISFPGNAPPHGLECGGASPCILYLRYNRPFDIKYFPEPPAPK